MSTFVRLPSGKIVNTWHVFAIETELDMYEGLRFGDNRTKLGRHITLASASGQPPDDGLGSYWLDKADADALVSALGIEFHEPAPSIAAQPDELAGG